MKKYSTYLLTGLRILVGWHFLYEGISKLVTPGWTAKMYLMGSQWIFSDLFHWMAASPGTMKVVDFLNIWGLILIGLSLFAGLLVRWSSIAGALLLLFYFVAYPPIPGHTLGAVTEGSYLWVNKTLIEFFIMLVFTVLPVEMFYGADRLIKRWKEEKVRTPVPSVKKEEKTSLQRRELLRDLISVPFLGAFAYAAYKKREWDSFEEKFLTKKPDATSGATLKSFNFASLQDLKGQVPKGKIGDLELSRLIMGGNLIGGWAHSRDLIYVSKLVKAYHSDERVMMTLQLAEKCGINTILCNPQLTRIINKYKHETGGKINFLSDCGHRDGFIEGIKQSQEGGAVAMYCQGEMSDRLARDGKLDEIVKGLELIRSYGKPAGIGAHRIETVKACVENGIKPDFWVKTLHHHNYWSAQPQAEWHDNMYCYKPQETIDFMNSLEEPWIAFKVLAAGAIQPKDGFQYAFDNGADFICVGMYDFQVVDDTNIVLNTLENLNRVRPWRG
ncbi:MAG: hypothetical protein A2W90_05430 [Bacteroidetes bacterium GWF2_42_66]|nr:MAG: hypothetical protein A2W92_03605 [Bacteroidetes bacterium GWA2_42_15]OFX96014.1 MAG: hypothetical protein A2W89_02840 [Bacteroidetes bacterium GWE2_42_39]OFY46587.1 MAG: hypothetical protein A2W90_05430 [Bacteroidetes bacterium GWF2_42_66]HBL75550.1 hypothetical protein [Prolixibacteraceae bacterium]HCR91081.1 hypothetical protein [Prolixibacteraceae bacterium]